MIRRSWFQSPLGVIFDNFFLPSLCKDLSDNLTETPIVKNSSVIVKHQYSADLMKRVGVRQNTNLSFSVLTLHIKFV